MTLKVIFANRKDCFDRMGGRHRPNDENKRAFRRTV